MSCRSLFTKHQSFDTKDYFYVLDPLGLLLVISGQPAIPQWSINMTGAPPWKFKISSFPKTAILGTKTGQPFRRSQ